MKDCISSRRKLIRAPRAGIDLASFDPIKTLLPALGAGMFFPEFLLKDIIQTDIIVWKLISETFYCVLHREKVITASLYQTYYVMSRDNYLKFKANS